MKRQDRGILQAWRRHDQPATLNAARVTLWLVVSISVAIALIWASGATWGADPAIVKTDNGCSGVIVTPSGVILSAEHCQCTEVENVFLGEKKLPVKLLYESKDKQQRDEVSVLQITEKGKYPYRPVAPSPPAISDKVFAAGFASTGYVDSPARLAAGNRHYYWLKDYTGLGPGMSGGPLFNKDRQVIGICSGGAGMDDDEGLQIADVSGGIEAARYIAHDEILKSLLIATMVYNATGKGQVVVFSLPDRQCPACDRLKRDIKSGFFRRYSPTVVTYDPETETWTGDGSKLYNEFYQQCGPFGPDFGFPTIWVRGTTNFRSGYDSENRGGLIGFLERILKGLAEIVVGPDETSSLPLPEPTPYERDEMPPPPPPLEPVPDPISGPSLSDQLAELKAQLRSVREQAQTAAAQAKEFQAAGVIGKLRSIDDIKETAGSLKAEVGNVRDTVTNIKNDADADPLAFVWSILGLITGLLHRRFAN